MKTGTRQHLLCIWEIQLMGENLPHIRVEACCKLSDRG